MFGIENQLIRIIRFVVEKHENSQLFFTLLNSHVNVLQKYLWRLCHYPNQNKLKKIAWSLLVIKIRFISFCVTFLPLAFIACLSFFFIRSFIIITYNITYNIYNNIKFCILSTNNCNICLFFIIHFITKLFSRQGY